MKKVIVCLTFAVFALMPALQAGEGKTGDKNKAACSEAKSTCSAEKSACSAQAASASKSACCAKKQTASKSVKGATRLAMH